MFGIDITFNDGSVKLAHYAGVFSNYALAQQEADACNREVDELLNSLGGDRKITYGVCRVVKTSTTIEKL